MKYSALIESDISFLKSVVGEERMSRGQSYLELHSVDETRYRGLLPDVVVWPKTTEEVSRTLKMADEAGQATPAEKPRVAERKLMLGALGKARNGTTDTGRQSGQHRQAKCNSDVMFHFLIMTEYPVRASTSVTMPSDFPRQSVDL